MDRDIGEDVELRLPVSGRFLEYERDATHPHGLPTSGISHLHRLLTEPAPADGALAYGAAEELTLQLAVLTDDERSATPSHTKHQLPGTKVAIFDPEVILTDVLEHLSNQAAFLGMAILAQKHIGNQHALLVEYH